jgi:hypothetical protein
MSSFSPTKSTGGRLVWLFALAFVPLFLGACAEKKPVKPRVAFVAPNTLPKPAPMRVATDTNSRRKAPLLPKTIVNIRDDSDSQIASPGFGDDFLPPAQPQVVSSATPQYISNEQPQDFFQGVGEAPAGETMLGSFFDSVFRPATPANQPANQPVSSATYKVE